MSFPQRRFLEAGATDAEVAVFQDEYDRLTEVAQIARAAQLASIGDGDLADLIALYREDAAQDPDPAGERDASDPEPDPDTVLGVVSPPAVADGADEAEEEPAPETEPEPEAPAG